MHQTVGNQRFLQHFLQSGVDVHWTTWGWGSSDFTVKQNTTLNQSICSQSNKNLCTHIQYPAIFSIFCYNIQSFSECKQILTACFLSVNTMYVIGVTQYVSVVKYNQTVVWSYFPAGKFGNFHKSHNVQLIRIEFEWKTCIVGRASKILIFYVLGYKHLVTVRIRHTTQFSMCRILKSEIFQKIHLHFNVGHVYVINLEWNNSEIQLNFNLMNGWFGKKSIFLRCLKKFTTIRTLYKEEKKEGEPNVKATELGGYMVARYERVLSVCVGWRVCAYVRRVW